MTYSDFLLAKTHVARPSGLEVDASALHPSLLPHQTDLTRWALRKGRAAIFAATGLGKTRMLLEWARLTGERALILAPLGVTRQTVAEAAAIGIEVVYARSQADAHLTGITCTNYEMARHFEPAAFGAVVIDESSILKDFEGKTRTFLIEAFRNVPFRLCTTATPAPNDVAELANHAEFLGIMSRTEMLATFFVHDDQGWRLKGHAREPFYRWLASWGMSLKRPSDLGYSDEGYILPQLSIRSVIVPANWCQPGRFIPGPLKGITDRAAIRKATVGDRVAATVSLLAAEPGESWIVWCGLNDEQNAVAETLGDRCVSIDGPMAPEDKLDREARWRTGEVPVLVTKPSIFGHGVNWQHCARMAFVGLSDSFEAYHQAIRRCWRFGQARPVDAYVVLTDVEEPIYANVLRKEREFEAMTTELVKHVAAYERAEIGQREHRDTISHEQPIRLPAWLQGAA